MTIATAGTSGRRPSMPRNALLAAYRMAWPVLVPLPSYGTARIAIHDKVLLSSDIIKNVVCIQFVWEGSELVQTVSVFKDAELRPDKNSKHTYIQDYRNNSTRAAVSQWWV